MLEVKRGPGRPPKVRPEAAPALTEQEAVPAMEIEQLDEVPTRIYQAPPAAAERLIEVEIMRKYAPAGQKQEIQRMVHPGTVMKLPVAEATRALKIGIARATDSTFG